LFLVLILCIWSHHRMRRIHLRKVAVPWTNHDENVFRGIAIQEPNILWFRIHELAYICLNNNSTSIGFAFLLLFCTVSVVGLFLLLAIFLCYMTTFLIIKTYYFPLLTLHFLLWCFTLMITRTPLISSTAFILPCSLMRR